MLCQGLSTLDKLDKAKQREKEQEKESQQEQESATATSLPVVSKSDILDFSSIAFSLDLTLSPSFQVDFGIDNRTLLKVKGS